MARDQQKASRPVRSRQRDEETTVSRGERIEPRKGQVRNSSIDYNRVRRVIRTKGKAVGRYHRRLRPSPGQVPSGGGGKLGLGRAVGAGGKL